MGRGEPGSRVIGFEGNFEKAPSALSEVPSALAQPLSAGSPEPAPRAGEALFNIHAERKDRICCVRGTVRIRLQSAW